MLEDYGLLQQPLLYVSAALKREQCVYYRHLSAVRNDGAWEAWVIFF